MGTTEVQRLATKGDSGAIVCADKPDGDKVTAIALLSGAKTDTYPTAGTDIRKTRYHTFLLHEGFEFLETKHGLLFQLCGSDVNQAVIVSQGDSIVQ